MCMAFPKEPKKSKRKKHKKSIIHQKDGTCYLCSMNGDYSQKRTEEHHIFGGPNRHISEAEGLTVYLCIDHHREGPEAVHRNKKTMDMLHVIGERAYERTHSRQQFYELFGRFYED